MNPTTPQTERKWIALPPEMGSAIQKWSNSFFRASIPTNLLSKSIVTEIKDERAKLLTAEFLYGERHGTVKEIPHDDSEITNRTDNLSEESLWLYGGGLSEAPGSFSEKSQSKFIIPTGKTKKCPKCRGEGKTNCFVCKGTGTDKSQGCRHCNGKGCRYCNGTGKATKDCSLCNGSGKRTCGKCDGFKYVQIVIEVQTRFNVEATKEHDYQGEIPPKQLKGTTGVVLFEETANYPEEKMREMLKGGIDRQEYTKLQSGVAIVFHALVDKKIQDYDGDINLVHGLVDNFFKQIPSAIKENRVLEREILPVRLRIKVEDVPVKRVSYSYKGKPYNLWVYGNEQKVYAKKRPLGVTGRLVVHWIIQLIIVGLFFYWFAGKDTDRTSDNRSSVGVSASSSPQPKAATYATTLQAAENGNPEAQNRLAVMYDEGDGFAKDSAEAVKWFRKAAEQGNADAQNNLALMYVRGDGVAKDPAEAVKLFTDAAIQGLAKAQNNLGVMYEDGNGVAKNDREAVKWFRLAAEQGFARAQNNLATKCLHGEGVAKDPVEAVKWFRKSAEQGFPDGQYNLAIMYNNGNGTAKDPVEAVKWYRKAAEQGFARAESSLAVKYFNGEGVAKDLTEAINWFTKAAEQGYSEAQYNLGQMYNAGTGVPLDYVQAAKWFNLAAMQGDADASRAYSKLAEIMSPEKISQAKALANEFVPGNATQ